MHSSTASCLSPLPQNLPSIYPSRPNVLFPPYARPPPCALSSLHPLPLSSIPPLPLPCSFHLLPLPATSSLFPRPVPSPHPKGVKRKGHLLRQKVMSGSSSRRDPRLPAPTLAGSSSLFRALPLLALFCCPIQCCFGMGLFSYSFMRLVCLFVLALSLSFLVDDILLSFSFVVTLGLFLNYDNYVLL